MISFHYYQRGAHGSHHAWQAPVNSKLASLAAHANTICVTCIDVAVFLRSFSLKDVLGRGRPLTMLWYVAVTISAELLIVGGHDKVACLVVDGC